MRSNHKNKIMKNFLTSRFIVAMSFATLISSASFCQTYMIVDPNQILCYNTTGTITCPASTQDFYGQDAQFPGNTFSYVLSVDGKTVYDNNSTLTWMRTPNMTNTPPVKANRMSYSAAQTWVTTVNAANYGGFNDWRIPTVKELYSLYDGRGTDPGGISSMNTSLLTPYIDTMYFKFAFGNTAIGERIIDQQYLSSNLFVVNPSESGFAKDFGVNFSDGRIKGYDTVDVLSMQTKTFYVQLVRGTTSYGINNFVDNADQTITDLASNLMWTKNDNGSGLDWKNALAWVKTQNSANYLGHNDWRMPSIKELQSIIDYSHAPDFDNLPCINTNYFNCSSITNEAGQADFPYYWSGTTHGSYSTTNAGGAEADYIPFGRALGWPTTQTGWVDVHGAGCQRSDPKIGPPYPYATTHTVTVNSITYTGYAHGPQGDAIRGSNYVRLVRDVPSANSIKENKEINFNVFPNPVSGLCSISFDKQYSKVKIEIYNTLGSKVKEMEMENAKNIDVDLGNFSNGVYLMNISFDNNFISKKIVKF